MLFMQHEMQTSSWRYI